MAAFTGQKPVAPTPQHASHSHTAVTKLAPTVAAIKVVIQRGNI